MAYTTINKSTAHCNTVIWTGTGSSNSITGVGFQPDFVWIKKRNGSPNHALFDALRGTGKYLESSATSPEQTDNNMLSAFGTDGFTVISTNAVNTNGDTYVGWNWKAANSSGSSNSNGSITSTVSANATAGFSIVKFVGNSTSGATVGHGLGVAPKFIIIKSRDTAYSWRSYHASLGATKYIELDSNAAAVTASNFMNNTAPTSTVFSLGNGDTPNKNGDNYIAYCFAEIPGFSKMGSYTGTENANGPFIYTGFRPSIVIIKKHSASTAQNWRIIDNKRLGYNPNNYPLYPSASSTEGTSETTIDIVSNGFKLRGTGGAINSNGTGYIYYAVGQSLVGSNNVPATAR